MQTEAIAAALKTKEQKHRVVKTTPTLRWPLLGDDGPDAHEVEEFYERHEDLCRLANDGRGHERHRTPHDVVELLARAKILFTGTIGNQSQ